MLKHLRVELDKALEQVLAIHLYQHRHATAGQPGQGRHQGLHFLKGVIANGGVGTIIGQPGLGQHLVRQFGEKRCSTISRNSLSTMPSIIRPFW